MPSILTQPSDDNPEAREPGWVGPGIGPVDPTDRDAIYGVLRKWIQSHHEATFIANNLVSVWLEKRDRSRDAAAS